MASSENEAGGEFRENSPPFFVGPAGTQTRSGNDMAGGGRTHIFSVYMSNAVEAGEFEGVERALKFAREYNGLDVRLYTDFITAAGNSGNFKRAKDIFDEAVSYNIVDVEIYLVYA